MTQWRGNYDTVRGELWHSAVWGIGLYGVWRGAVGTLWMRSIVRGETPRLHCETLRLRTDTTELCYNSVW